MSQHIARSTMERMNLRAVAVAPQHSSLLADLQMLASADPQTEQAALEARRAELCSTFGLAPSQQRKPFAFGNGIAIIPVHGSLINRFGSSYGYVTGYNFIRAQVAAAGQDEDVKGIVFDLHSNGGEVAGCFECAAEIPRLANGKPTLGVIDSNCYSACYAIGSALDRLVATPSGGAGSIGVVAMHVDMSKMLLDAGVKVTFIHAGDHKVDGNPYEELPEDVRADIQAEVDKTRDQFVALVSTNRQMDAKKVKDTEARTYRAEDALALGLIDAVVSPNEALQAFFGELSGSTHQPQKEDTMSAIEVKPEATQADLAKASADARAAERARYAGIINHAEAKGRESLASHLASNTEMSVEEAGALLAVSPKAAEPAAAAAGNPFKNVMDADKHPQVGADTNVGSGGEQSLAQQILQAQSHATGIKAKA